MLGTIRILSSPAVRHPLQRFNRVPTVYSRLLSANTDEHSKTAVVRASEGLGKARDLFKKYGYTFVGTYFSVYLVTLGSMYLALDYDLFSASTFGLDPVTLTKKACDTVEFYTGNTELPAFIRHNPWAGVFAIAWVMTKFTEPVRIGATVLLVPRIARYLGKKV